MVFCQGCGSKLLQIGKFCHNCGLDLAQTAPGGPPCKRPSSALSFGDFKKKKEADRSSKFEKKNDRRSQKKEVAKVQVGLVCDKSETGDLTKVKGRTIPILLNANADAASLLSTSVEKHSRHFKQFNPYQDYVILYSDLSVVKYLPGTNTPFTLEKYKEDLFKSYSKIYFWLCEKKHFENANDDTGSNEDEELEKPSIDIGCSGSTTKTTAPTRSRSTGKVVSWSSTATISSPSITVPGNVVGDVDTAKPSGLHQCPTCLSHFPYMEIEEHADACAESWVDPIGAMPLSIEIPSEDEENENKKEPNEREEQETDMEGIKNAVDNLKTVLGSTVSNRVSIRRSSAFQDYLVARRKKWFKPKAILKVIFIGEPAVDDGGPKREFFTETLNHVRCTLIDDDGIPYPDMRALSNDEFKAAGELIAASIIQGGPAPSFLADTVYEYIVDGMASIETKNWVSLVKDSTLKESIEKITDCTTDKQLRDLLNEDTMLEKLQIVGYRL